MRKFRAWVARIGGLCNKGQKDSELDDEIESHIQMHIEENVRLGMEPEEARRQAMIKLGGVDCTKEAYRDQRGLPALETLWQDVRYGARMLRKNPGFTCVAALTLALGIGANTALFTALDTVMFRPLRAPNANRLVFVANGREETFSFPFYERLRQSMDSFSGCAGAQYRVARRELGGSSSETESISAQGVTGSFFAVLGVPPLLGRTFVEEDDRTGAAQPVVVISHALWERQFGSDRAIVGRNVRLDELPVTVVGVMPPDFFGFQADVRPDVWWPLQLVSQLEPGRRGNALGEGVSWLVLFGRLREGVARERAQAEARVFFRRELENQISKNPNRPTAERERILSQTLDLRPGNAGFVGARAEFMQPLVILMAAVGVVLVIACANIAGLLLARGAARQREFAVRAALGAGRLRIVRQLVTENVLLAFIGGAVGLLFARWGTAFLTNFLAQSRAPVALVPDIRALLFTIVVSALTAAVFGLAPAWRISRFDLVTAMKNQGNAVSGSSRTSLQRLLVISQVALSALLLAGAGLFGRTLQNLRTLDFGFHNENLITLSVEPGRAARDPAQAELLLRRLLAELGTLPGVHSVSIGGAGLLTGNGISMDVNVDGYSPAPDEEMKTSAILAGPRFFETLRVPLLSGREFTRTDEPAATTNGEPAHATVAIIGEAMARKFFGNSDPVGKFLKVEDKIHLEIVGAAKDTKYSPNLRKTTPLEFYVPFFGSGIRMPPTFYLRGERDVTGVVSEIRQLLKKIDPQLQIRELRSMNEVIDRLLLRERIIAQLVGFFSAFALLLACLGLYGTLSFQVAQRTREIGVRMALGGTLRGVIALVIRQGLALVLWGGVFGIGAALGTTRFVSTLLYGVTPTDPLTFVAVISVFMAAALLASWLPARRAANVDPMVALRYE